MAAPAPATKPDTTDARQQRRLEKIDQKRQRMEAQLQAERRRNVLLIAAAIVAAAAIIGWFGYQRVTAIPSPGHEVAIEGIRQHIPDGEPIAYKNRPPSSGNHYGSPTGYGFFQRELPAGNFVHTLEHGGVVILYRPDLCDAACQKQLQDLYTRAPISNSFHVAKMALIPYEQMDHAIAGLAWGWIDEMDQVNADELMTFYRAHLDQGPEQAL